MARVIYDEADVYLFDDCFSGLDSRSIRSIMDQVMLKFLKGKTRILNVHQLELLKYFDKIVYLKDGRIEEFGSFEDLMNNSKKFQLFHASNLNNKI